MAHLAHRTAAHGAIIGCIASRPCREVKSDIPAEILRIGQQAAGRAKDTLSERRFLEIGAIGPQAVADGALRRWYVCKSERGRIHLKLREDSAAHVLIVGNAGGFRDDSAEKREGVVR